jgi:beta-RFAP synthase
MISVVTGSRIHFGLARVLQSLHGWPGNISGYCRYAGIGLMTERPGLTIRASPAKNWSAEGPLGHRTLEFAQRLGPALCCDDIPPLHFSTEGSAREHRGFGTGTQLALAVARLVVLANEQAGITTGRLAQILRRGTRTGIGVTGFERGGLLFDRGGASETSDPDSVLRRDFPESWRLVLFVPPGAYGLHGEVEQAAFEQMELDENRPVSSFEGTVRLMEDMWTAAGDQDFGAFSDAVHEFNARVGELFAWRQGGIYAHPLTAEIIENLRRQGIRGVGQTSWGPAGFAVAPDENYGRALAEDLQRRFKLDDSAVTLTGPANQGAKISVC